MSIISTLKTLFSDSATAKGKKGEMTSKALLSLGLKKEDSYRIFHDVTLHTPDNSTTQIDHIVISPFGVFVIEVKNYGGWIYGSEKQYKWTQVFENQTKYQFLNPLIQNQKHLQAVQKLLDVEDRHIHSLVVFTGRATFKTEMPDNVMYLRYMNSYIRKFDRVICSEQKFNKFIRRLNSRKLTQGHVADTVHMTHIQRKKEQNIQTKFKKSTQAEDLQNPNDRICPKCGSQLIKRLAKKGKNMGNEFYGCSSFPKCRYTTS